MIVFTPPPRDLSWQGGRFIICVAVMSLATLDQRRDFDSDRDYLYTGEIPITIGTTHRRDPDHHRDYSQARSRSPSGLLHRRDPDHHRDYFTGEIPITIGTTHRRDAHTTHRRDAHTTHRRDALLLAGGTPMLLHRRDAHATLQAGRPYYGH